MNRPPDWGQLARDIADNDTHQSKVRALIVTNSRMVATDLIIPEFLRAIPTATLRQPDAIIILPYGSTIHFRAILSDWDEEKLRGMRFDLIFFDPVWSGTAEQMMRINHLYRERTDASR